MNGDLAGQLLADIDPEMLAFLRAKVNTFIKWDLARFFHDNPHTTDTADNIARYAGRDPVAIAAELSEMAEAGILTVHHVGGLKIYSLSGDEKVRSLIARFIKACDDRRFRVRAIYHVIRGMR